MLYKINDKLTFIISELGFTYCNCIFIDDKVKAIIDTGADKRSLDEIKPEQVEKVINTHHHYDHTRGNHFFTNAEIFIHPLDYPVLQSRKNFEYYNSLDKWDELMPGYDFIQCRLQMGFNEEEVEKSLRADRTFEDGDIFNFGRTEVEVIHTPGHSAGHCSFWFPEEEFLFTGDICLTEAGPWYGEIYASADDMLNSIDKLIKLKPRIMTSCHINDICTDGVKRLTEFKNRIFKREERIYNYLKGREINVHDLASQKLIYRMHPSPFVIFWEKLMLLKHLERLELQGLIQKSEEGLYRAK